MFIKSEQVQENLDAGDYGSTFDSLYGVSSSAQRKRYIDAITNFNSNFGSNRAVALFSTPGRSEIGGNHTDHQLGCVLAAAIDLDIIAVVSKNDSDMVRIVSEGYAPLILNITELNKSDSEENTTAALVRGILSRFFDLGKSIGGFDAYITSNVPKGSGLSSSAAFSVLISTILDNIYNDGDMTAMQYAKTAQYAENVYFAKPCGLMDQLACANGGFIFIDFFDKDEPLLEPIDADIKSLGYTPVIVNAGGCHDELTNEYAAITDDMASVANFFGKKMLSRVNESDFYENLPALRRAAGDRAIMRAMHFFDETTRAKDEAQMLRSHDIDGFLRLVNDSGESSFALLQNVCPADKDERSVAFALAFSKHILHGKGAQRIHGGGFAGTILAFVPTDMLDNYICSMNNVFGANSCAALNIRHFGSICLNKLILEET